MTTSNMDDTLSKKVSRWGLFRAKTVNFSSLNSISNDKSGFASPSVEQWTSVSSRSRTSVLGGAMGSFGGKRVGLGDKVSNGGKLFKNSILIFYFCFVLF